jgi:hypothetical protein
LHAPQFIGSVKLVSQPFDPRPSQSAKPALQASKHFPFEHVAVPLIDMHELSQPPPAPAAPPALLPMPPVPLPAPPVWPASPVLENKGPPPEPQAARVAIATAHAAVLRIIIITLVLRRLTAVSIPSVGETVEALQHTELSRLEEEYNGGESAPLGGCRRGLGDRWRHRRGGTMERRSTSGFNAKAQRRKGAIKHRGTAVPHDCQPGSVGSVVGIVAAPADGLAGHGRSAGARAQNRAGFE